MTTVALLLAGGGVEDVGDSRPLAGGDAGEAEPLAGELALPEATAKDCGLPLPPRSLFCSPAGRVGLGDLGGLVLARPEGATGAETRCRGTRKPTDAITATAAKAAIPVATSQAVNGLGADVEFMMR